MTDGRLESMKAIKFNDDWTFRKQGEEQKYQITIPHDASFFEGRDADSPGGSPNAFFKGGTYEYEKSFFVPTEWQGGNVEFQFEGVYQDGKVYLNGELVGGCAYGYSEFWVNVTEFLQYGQDNVLKVIADNSDLPNSRWYAGAGIYRPVTMWIGAEQYIKSRGIKITTLSAETGMIRIETDCTGGDVLVEIIAGGELVANGYGVDIEIVIPNAKLWSDETPYLYECHVTLTADGKIVDKVTERFGIRSLAWCTKGFFVNGKETLLRGGCVHSDNGIIGACSYKKSEYRRVKLLKEMGYNAIRVSHNPASESMITACDELGMYVIDETWDMWYAVKSKYDYGLKFMENYRFDIESMVARDYNHPSVIMYSIGNENSEPATKKGVDLAHKMADFVRELDSTRPVTAGVNLFVIRRSAKGNAIYAEGGGLNNSKEEKVNKMNSTMFNLMTSIVGTGMNKAANSKKADLITKPVFEALDIAGYNYASGRYKLEAKENQNRIVVGSETFPQDIAKNWKMVEEIPYLIGDFMWTAWDYLGEVGLGAWAYTQDGKSFNKPYPWLLADTGAFDILGNPNGEAFLAKTVWGLSKKPLIAVQPINHETKPTKAVWRGTNAIPSWSWQGCEGKRAIVEIYSDATVVALSLNGRHLGRKRVKNCLAKFKVDYQPGTLIAASYDENNQKIATTELHSATGDTQIRAVAEEKEVGVGEIVYVKVELIGENGVVESNSDAILTASVLGGTLLGFGSANPRTTDDFTAGEYKTYYGQAQAVVRADKVGFIEMTISGERLKTEKIAIKVAE